jgi:hypothetical protein
MFKGHGWVNLDRPHLLDVLIRKKNQEVKKEYALI